MQPQTIAFQGGCLDLLKALYPETVEIVKSLLNDGHSPADIEEFARREGATPLTLSLIVSVAQEATVPQG
jgi:hypothetical protein